MKLSPFQYHAPISLSSCVHLLKYYQEEAALVAGGTELFVRMKLGLLKKAHLISMSAIRAIDGVSTDEKGALTIGAGTTLSTLAESPVVRKTLPALAEATSLVATTQIRNMATLGGNLFQETRCFYYNRSATWRKAVPACFKRGGDVCHVVPKGTRCFAVYQGDIAPLLIALGSKAIFFRNGKKEEAPLEDLFTGEGKSPFRTEEQLVLARVSIPPLGKGGYAAYRKYRLRNGMDFPLAGVAIMVNRKAGNIEALKICLTGVSSAPVIVSEASELAQGKSLTAELTALIADAAYKAAHPVSNLESSPSHRRSMVRLMTEEMLAAI
jgi:4-hydroxybenzoyl-CoA reductase subunit beta